MSCGVYLATYVGVVSVARSSCCGEHCLRARVSTVDVSMDSGGCFKEGTS